MKIMFEKIEIIYAFNGYADPNIKNVERTRVNGYKTIITKEGEKEMTEEYKLRNILAKDAKKILELLDEKNISVEEIELFIKKRKEVEKMTNEKTDDEKRFSAEEIKVNKYLEDHKSENLTYRDAVVAVLDRSEPEIKKEFTAEEKKQKEDLKKIEEYILAHPRSSYKDAVRVVLNKEELTLEEKLVDEYMSKNPKSTYKEAVVEALSLLPILPKKEE